VATLNGFRAGGFCPDYVSVFMQNIIKDTETDFRKHKRVNGFYRKAQEKTLKKTLLVILFITAVLTAACSSLSGGSASPGKLLYSRAVTNETAGSYISAATYYQQALPILRQEGNSALIRDCRVAAKRTSLIVSDFSKTGKQVRDTLSQTFEITEKQIDFLLSRIAYLDIAGTRYYYDDFLDTSMHLDLTLMQQKPDVMARNRLGYSTLEPLVNTPGPVSGSPYINPITYQATAIYNVPRNLLPSAGLLKIWQPVPIMTDCQTEVAMISVIPAGYIANPATLNGTLGDIYLEVPLAELTSDLQIEVKFKLRHYEQRFTIIDPNNVGIYDTSSALYKAFTASGKNTRISPEIAARARQIVGAQRNPYYAARLLYDHIVNNLTYSHVPHGSLGFLNIPESVYVHNHGYGDCGAQSMYFTALCRSIGIPARATGGYQLFPGMEGAHFWAEFYLPNYGWVPVDTSVAQIANYLPELTPAKKQAFKDYLFGSMDPYRWVIQKDVDLPFSPPAPEPTALSIVLQSPAILCDEMDDIPEEIIWPYYQIHFVKTP
jgi:hypothetical protein